MRNFTIHYPFTRETAVVPPLFPAGVAAPSRFLQQVGDDAESARGELVELVMEDERGVGVAAFADGRGEQRAFKRFFACVVHGKERHVGFVPFAREIEAAFFVPVFPVGRADFVGVIQERMVGGEMGDGGVFVGYAVADGGRADQWRYSVPTSKNTWRSLPITAWMPRSSVVIGINSCMMVHSYVP